MAKHELFIPSAISQSCFYQDDKIIIPEANEFNYFIALLYLYRTNLIKENTGIKIFIDQDTEELTSKKKKKQMLNPKFNNFTVEIEMSEFQELGVVNNNTYSLLKTYLQDKLNLQYIEVDILGTKKVVDNTRIDIVDNFTIDNNILEITFTYEFVKMILHCDIFWMEVNLYNIFNLTSYKAQKLYLLVKDYSSLHNGYIQVSKKYLEMIIGKMPQKATQISLCKTITTKTDMEISIGKPIGNKLKKYSIKIEYQDNYGSGVICKVDNNKAYILTAKHNFCIDNSGTDCDIKNMDISLINI